MNLIKHKQQYPEVLEHCNISSLYKHKGSHKDFNNYRGVFRVTVFWSILDRLIYNDNYHIIDEHLTDGNVGALFLIFLNFFNPLQNSLWHQKYICARALVVASPGGRQLTLVLGPSVGPRTGLMQLSTVRPCPRPQGYSYQVQVSGFLSVVF